MSMTLVQNVGGFVPADAYANVLFRKPGHGNHWLGLQLTGTRTNKAAIGARIAVTVRDGTSRRQIHRVVGSGGSFGANALAQHVGLGAASVVERLEVYWPVSRTTQVFEALPAGRVFRITEGSSAVAVVR